MARSAGYGSRSIVIAVDVDDDVDDDDETRLKASIGVVSVTFSKRIAANRAVFRFAQRCQDVSLCDLGQTHTPLKGLRSPCGSDARATGMKAKPTVAQVSSPA